MFDPLMSPWTIPTRLMWAKADAVSRSFQPEEALVCNHHILSKHKHTHQSRSISICVFLDVSDKRTILDVRRNEVYAI